MDGWVGGLLVGTEPKSKSEFGEKMENEQNSIRPSGLKNQTGKKAGDRTSRRALDLFPSPVLG